MRGKILNVGGSRGRSKLYLSSGVKVITVDINKKFKPDVVADVQKLPFKNNTFDLVIALELFEHVKKPEKGIGECVRVLKKGGYFIFSMPFLYPFHADPFDWQRWTKVKIKDVLNNNPVKIKKFKVQGYYFTVLADFIKRPILNSPLLLRYFLYFLVMPLTFLLIFLDEKVSKNNVLLKSYHAGYFIICQKK